MRVEVVYRTPKPTLEKAARIWAQEWAKENRKIDLAEAASTMRGFEFLPRRWVVESIFS